MAVVQSIELAGEKRIGQHGVDASALADALARSAEALRFLKGFHADGHAYIPQALERGAVAIVAETERPDALPTTWVRVANSRTALAPLAAAFYGHPGESLRVGVNVISTP